MARILIFVGSSTRLKEYADAGFNVLRRVTFSESLEKFNFDENGIMVAGSEIGIVGYRVPAGTFAVFDRTWPYSKRDPETIQALARVDRGGFHA